MIDKKGLSLIELLVVLVIVGILAAIALPNYTTFLLQGASKAAQSNLISIYNAENNFYFTNSSYCTANTAASAACKLSTGGDALCADSLAAINCNLSLNINDNNSTYKCFSSGPDYFCSAQSVSNANLQLKVTNEPPNNTIILPGGPGCTAPTLNKGWIIPCNPSCNTTRSVIDCPTS